MTMIAKQKILSVLAMVLMVMAYGLPTGLHFKFCVGEDGHWDISVVACASDEQTPVSNSSYTDPTDHHGECTDYTTACHKKNTCRTSFVSFSQRESAKVFQLTAIAEAPGIIALPTIKPSAFPSSSEPSVAQPAYLRTVVLLI